MKIDPRKRRTRLNPLYGVTFDRAEQKRISETALTLTSLNAGEILTLKAAIGTEVSRLEDASDWAHGPTEDERAELYRDALYLAAALGEAVAAKASIN